MLGGWQLKLIAAGLLLAAIGGAVWHVKSVTAERDEYRAQARQLTASLKAEQEDRRKADAKSAEFQKDLKDLRADRADNPLPAVVCKRPRLLPAASEAAPRPDGARPADDPPEDAGDRDIGPQLDEFATACEANLIQLTRLQEWVRGR